MTKQDVTALFTQWNEALLSKDAKAVTALYAKNATLLPTVSNKIRHNHAEIEDYFIMFLKMSPSGELLEQNIRVLNDIAINSGVYRFKLEGNVTVDARYSYVYQKIGEEWKIIEHHSSAMPEQ